MQITRQLKGGAMKKILVAHDGSKASDKALLEAAAIAQKFGADLVIIAVVPNLCFSEIGVDCDTVTGLYRAEIQGSMKGVKALLHDKSITAETIILEGKPADMIVDYSKSKNISLIVVGASGKQASERVILGSVSSKVVANAPCSVLVVR
jgi:nucleotide-binding universal stress UspA family protein